MMQNLNLPISEDSSEEAETDEDYLDGPSFDPIEFVLGEENNDNLDSET